MATRVRRRWLVELLATRVQVEHALRQHGLDVAVSRLAPPVGRVPAPPSEVEAIGELTGRLLRNRRWPRTTCLHRALTRFVMLRRRGLAPTFVVGVREGSEPIEGHAWLELNGVPMLEPEPPDCTPTFRFPATP